MMKKILLILLLAPCTLLTAKAQTLKQKVNVSEVKAVATTKAENYAEETFDTLKGVVDVTYDGTDKFPGHFTKTITIRSNAVNEVVRLTIEGTME